MVGDVTKEAVSMAGLSSPTGRIVSPPPFMADAEWNGFANSIAAKTTSVAPPMIATRRKSEGPQLVLCIDPLRFWNAQAKAILACVYML
jgi:hypothetical protein